MSSNRSSSGNSSKESWECYCGMEELPKQAKKEKRSNVILFVSLELSIALLFAFIYVFVLDHVLCN
jgi:hypothetical protein